MTWPGLVLKNLLRRKVRTALTVGGVAIGVGLIVALLSITNGVKQTANELIHVGRSDFGLFQEGASDLTRSLLPEGLADGVRSTPGVARVARIFLLVGEVEGSESSLLFGYAQGEFPERRLVVVSGRRPNRVEALVGDGAARIYHLRVGGDVQVGRRTFRVAGVFHSGNRFVDRGVVLPLATVQALAQRPHEVTTLGVIVELGATPKAVAARLERQFSGVTAVIEPGQAVKVDTSSRLIVTAGWIFSLLALIIGGIGVTNTMAMAVFERTREIGIMRAVGWSSARIAALIVSESLGIGLLALGIGLLGGWGAAVLFTEHSSLSSLTDASFTGGVFAWGLAFALGVALLGALYPAWRAIRLTPIEALRRE
ncbi:MAG TPA: ABC transporter permease [Gaiellaceae bacterium]|nr:ABC transporter permease [Gaiellaceae bacterium]